MIVLPLVIFQISIHKFLDCLIFDRNFSSRYLGNAFFSFHSFHYSIWTFIFLFFLDFHFPFLFGIYFSFLFGLLFPFSIWIFFPFSIRCFFPLFYLDFYFPFLCGLLFPFSIWTFILFRFVLDLF